ncbi:MAG: DUF5320 domain-containing protein [Candidatus Micrarchaeia archaeon]
MPNGDGTGPQGAGRMTGRGLGPYGGATRGGRGFGRRAALYGGCVQGLSVAERRKALEETKAEIEAELASLKE